MWLKRLVQTLLGLVLAATPVLLWVAWSPAMLAGILVLALLCAVLLVLLTEAHPARGTGDVARLPDEFFAEVQNLHPMIHHHSGRRSSLFQRTMRRLARLTPPARG